MKLLLNSTFAIIALLAAMIASPVLSQEACRDRTDETVAIVLAFGPEVSIAHDLTGADAAVFVAAYNRTEPVSAFMADRVILFRSAAPERAGTMLMAMSQAGCITTGHWMPEHVALRLMEGRPITRGA